MSRWLIDHSCRSGAARDRPAGISEQTFYRWKAKYAGLEVDQVRQMAQLQEENLTFDGDGPERGATALLECIGLLPRQRRIFISYRRDEAREAALQLFNSLSAKIYDMYH